MFILDTSKVAGDEAGAVKGLHALLERNNAEVISTRRWQEGKLAYPVNGQKKGLYYLIYFRAEGKSIITLEGDFRLSEVILRYLISKVAPKHVEKMLECGHDGGPMFFPTVTEVALDEAAIANLGAGLTGMPMGGMGGDDADRRGGGRRGPRRELAEKEG
jgi:small subunit ribosomal protein S6